jgi:hypothetical protein
MKSSEAINWEIMFSKAPGVNEQTCTGVTQVQRHVRDRPCLKFQLTLLIVLSRDLDKPCQARPTRLCRLCWSSCGQCRHEQALPLHMTAWERPPRHRHRRREEACPRAHPHPPPTCNMCSQQDETLVDGQNRTPTVHWCCSPAQRPMPPKVQRREATGHRANRRGGGRDCGPLVECQDGSTGGGRRVDAGAGRVLDRRELLIAAHLHQDHLLSQRQAVEDEQLQLDPLQRHDSPRSQ